MSGWHQSAAWRAVRLAAKRRDGWRCVRCGARVGLEVDHVQPREARPDLALALDNLQTLCRDCHIDKTRRDQNATALPGAKEWREAILSLCRRPSR